MYHSKEMDFIQRTGIFADKISILPDDIYINQSKNSFTYPVLKFHLYFYNHGYRIMMMKIVINHQYHHQYYHNLPSKFLSLFWIILLCRQTFAPGFPVEPLGPLCPLGP